MNDNYWGEFEVQSDFPDAFRFEAFGDSIVGTISKLRRANFPDGTVPELWIDIDDGTTRSVLASWRNLQAQLARLRPSVGDRIAIVYIGIGQAKPGKSAPRLFDVDVNPGGNVEAVPTATPPATSPAPAQPAAPAAMSAASILG